MMAIRIVEMNEENLKMEKQIIFIIFIVFLIADSRYLQEPEIIHGPIIDEDGTILEPSHIDQVFISSNISDVLSFLFRQSWQLE